MANTSNVHERLFNGKPGAPSSRGFVIAHWYRHHLINVTVVIMLMAKCRQRARYHCRAVYISRALVVLSGGISIAVVEISSLVMILARDAFAPR